jgi:hypothetical protein
MHWLQSFTPFGSREKSPPQLLPRKYKGQKQNRQLKSAEGTFSWHGKYSQDVFAKNE